MERQLKQIALDWKKSEKKEDVMKTLFNLLFKIQSILLQCTRTRLVVLLFLFYFSFIFPSHSQLSDFADANNLYGWAMSQLLPQGNL